MARIIQVHRGGTYAPPIDEEKLSQYREFAEKFPEPQIKEMMLKNCDMVEQHLRKQASTLPGSLDHAGRGIAVPLTDETKEALDEFVPWEQEHNMWQKLLEKFCAVPANQGLKQIEEWVDAPKSEKNPNGTEKMLATKTIVIDKERLDMVTAAKHLLWYAWELCRDREPMFIDKMLPTK